MYFLIIVVGVYMYVNKNPLYLIEIWISNSGNCTTYLTRSGNLKKHGSLTKTFFFHSVLWVCIRGGGGNFKAV